MKSGENPKQRTVSEISSDLGMDINVSPITLKEYLARLAPKHELRDELLNRPFDAANFSERFTKDEINKINLIEGSMLELQQAMKLEKSIDTTTKKRIGEFGVRAKQFKPNPDDLNNFGVEKIESIRKRMEEVLKDLEGNWPEGFDPNAEENKDIMWKIKSGYIFNALNQEFGVLMKEYAKSGNKDKLDEVSKLSELYRIIADDLAKGKTPAESHEHINETLDKKVNEINVRLIHAGVTDLMSSKPTFEFNKIKKKLDKLNLELSGINVDDYKKKLFSYAGVGASTLEVSLSNPKKTSEAVRKDIKDIQGTLMHAWSRVANAMDKKIVKSEFDFANGEMAIRGHKMTKDYEKVIQLANDIISIRDGYEKRLGGLYRKDIKNPEKVKLLNEIKNKMMDLVGKYPEEIKSITELRGKMLAEVRKIMVDNKDLLSNSKMTSHLERLCTKLEAQQKHDKLETNIDHQRNMKGELNKVKKQKPEESREDQPEHDNRSSMRHH